MKELFTVENLAILAVFSAITAPDWGVRLRGFDWRIVKIAVATKYVAWCVGYYFCLSFVLPEYVAVVLTTFFTVAHLMDMSDDEKQALWPRDIQIIIPSKKVRPISLARGRSAPSHSADVDRPDA